MSQDFKIDPNETSKAPPSDAKPAEQKPAETTPAAPAAPPQPVPPGAKPAGTAPEKESGVKVEGSSESDMKVEGASELPHAAAPAESASASEEEEKEGSKSTFWIIVGILFLLILVVGGGYIYANSKDMTLMELVKSYTSGEEDSEDEDMENEETETTEVEETEETEEGEEEEELSMWEGTYVTAELPEGWTITEYYDGDGSEMLVDGPTYAGLTGLTVNNPEGVTVFKLEGVQGIGGPDSCENYYQFSDSGEDYYNDIVANSALVGVTPTVVEIAEGDYTESSLFGLELRRAGYNIYWNKSEDEGVFNAACGIEGRILSLDTLTFDTDGTATGSYQFTVVSTATATELGTLDEILHSLEVL